MSKKHSVRSTIKAIPLSLLSLSIMSINAMLISSTVNAEEASIASMVITGEKIDKNIKDTTTAVTLITDDQLSSGEAKRVKEVATKAPNVINDAFGNISVRGMSGGGAATGGAALITGSRARVVTVVDGSTQDWSGYNFTPSTLWDVEQVEILRGPQSTTQGSSAIGGAIVINTKDPSFANEAAVRVGLDSFKNGNLKHNLAAMLSGPIVENELAYRIAIDTSKGKGWLNYDTANYDVPELSDAESINVRAKLLWEPQSIPELSAKLTVNHHKNKGEHASFASNTEKGIATQTLDISTTISRVQDSAENAFALDVDYELSPGITNILHINQINSDIYAKGYQQTKVFTYDIDQKSTSLENRLIFNADDTKWTGVLGLFFAKKNSSIHANQNILIDTEYETDTTAIYGESSYAISPQTTATIGLRIENEDVDKTGSFFRSGQLEQDSNKTYYLPKLEFTHAISDATTLGASVRKGYSPSGSGITFGGEVYDYNSEEVTSYELSSKSSFGDNTTVNANVFYNDYTNYQALSGLSILNVDAVHSYGLELEANTWANDSLELWGSVGLLKTKIDEDKSFKGNELSSAPDTNLSIGFNQYLGSKWSVGADVTYVGKYFSELGNSSTSAVGDHAITNARVQYTSGDLTFNGYIKNLTNEDAVYYRSGALARVGQTRTIGISAVYRM